MAQAALTLIEPRGVAAVAPPPRLTSYRYWVEFKPEYLAAIRDAITRVLNDKARQLDMFAPSSELLELASEARERGFAMVALEADAEAVEGEAIGLEINPFSEGSLLWEIAETLGMVVTQRDGIRVTDEAALRTQKLMRTTAIPDYSKIRRLIQDGTPVEGAERTGLEYVLRPVPPEGVKEVEPE